MWGGKRDRPGAGWGAAWRVWYQVGPTVSFDLTEQCVEIRWTTDGHTLGDGTFRGDLQPGKAAIRFWDPERVLDGLDKQGAMWASYTPTGATWWWFYDSVQRALTAPGDPTFADVVFNGITWPARLTNPMGSLPVAMPVQSVTARLQAVVAGLTAATMDLPQISANVATQNQTVPAPVVGSAGLYPPDFDLVRTAAADGYAWLSAGRDATGAGILTLNYARWDTATARPNLDKSQIVAGPTVTESVDWAITTAGFAATTGAGVASSLIWAYPQGTSRYGWQGPTSMRLVGDLTSGSAPEYAPASTTLRNITSNRGNPAIAYIDTVSLQSGERWTPDGRPSTALWDPTVHAYNPTDTTVEPNSGYTVRVTQSAHTLNAKAWQTSHTLEQYVPAVALP